MVIWACLLAFVCSKQCLKRLDRNIEMHLEEECYILAALAEKSQDEIRFLQKLLLLYVAFITLVMFYMEKLFFV